jgi:tetratricopeptide (TPR) repeat protein
MYKFLTLLLFTSSYNFYCQEVPPPPPPAPSYSNEKRSEKPQESDELIESNSLNNEICNIELFKIDSTSFTDKSSKYYYEKIKSKLNVNDLEISSEEIIAYTKYRNSLNLNPFKIDSIASVIYKLNENSKFEEAIKLSIQLKSISPNNITLHKELAYAYKKLGQTELSEKHFEMLKKIISAVEKYSDGCRINPYILNNCFEGISLYEAKFSLYPSKTRFILTESKKIIYGYDIYHIMRFANLNHYKEYLKKGEYKIE